MVANKRSVLVGTAMFIAAAYAGLAQAQMYSWRDASGKMNYGYACPAGTTCKLKL